MEIQNQTENKRKDHIQKIIQNEKGNPLFKKAASVLESINQSIEKVTFNQSSSSAYDTALYCAVLSGVEASVNKQTFEKIDAFLLLLHVTIHKVNPGIRQKTANKVLELIDKILKNVQKGEIEIKYIISIYNSILLVKTESEWKQEQTMKKLEFILDYLTNEKNKLRKSASKALTSLVHVLLHGLCKISEVDFYLQNFCLEIIKNGFASPKPCTYLLFFLNNSLKNFPIRTASDISFNLVALLKNEDLSIELATHIYSTIDSLLTARPLNASIIEGFLGDFLNNPPQLAEDSNINYAYIQCLGQTLIRYHSLEPIKSQHFISSVILACNDFLAIPNSKLSALATKTIEAVINTTISSTLWNKITDDKPEDDLFDFDNLEIQKQQNGPTPFQKIISSLIYLTSSQFDRAQSHVSSILTLFFEKLDAAAAEQSFELLVRWIGRKPDLYVQFWDPVIGKFIQNVSVQLILETYRINPLAVSISHENFESETNSWLLPILKKYLQINSISLFFDYFFPIIAKMDDVVYSKPRNEFNNGDMQLEFLYIQLWALFPRFCRFSKENTNYIEEIFKICTTAIANRDEIRKYVCFGLEILSGYFLKLPKFSSPEMVAVQELLSTSSSKLFAKLCTLYLAQKPGYKNVISLIKAISGLCVKETLERVYLTHIKKLIEEQVEGKHKEHAITNMRKCDILVAIATSIDMSKNYEVTRNFVKIFLTEKFGYQKKAFKMLQVLSVKVHPSFLVELYELIDSVPIVNANSKHSKYLCLMSIFEKLEFKEDNIEEVIRIVQKILPEIVLSMKETSNKVRKVGVDILRFLATKFDECGIFTLYLSYITAGFAAKSSLMKACSILALGDIMKHLKDKIQYEFLWETTTLVLLLVKDKNREIYRSVIHFIKVYLKIAPKNKLGENLHDLLIALFEWDEDGRNHSKMLLRHLIEKFLRKLGRENLEKSIPEEHKNLVKYLAKQEKISQKKKNEKREERKLQIENQTRKPGKMFGKTTGDDEYDEEEEEEKYQVETIPARASENSNNLLLKFDSLKEKFHFVEEPLAKNKQKQVRNDLAFEERDVVFDEQNGKILVADEENVTGKKRRRENKFGAEMEVEEEEKKAPNAEAPRRVRKVVKLNEERIVAKKDTEEEESKKDQNRNSEHEPKVRINKKIISDIKLLNSDTLNPTAYIPINPKLLNKRNRTNAAKAFEFLISKKKSGSLAGLKSKIKS